MGGLLTASYCKAPLEDLPKDVNRNIIVFITWYLQLWLIQKLFQQSKHRETFTYMYIYACVYMYVYIYMYVTPAFLNLKSILIISSPIQS